MKHIFSKRITILFCSLVFICFTIPRAYSETILFKSNKTTFIYIDKNEKQVVYSAFALLQKDVKTVFDADLLQTNDKSKAQIIVSSLKGKDTKWETFQIDTQKNKLYISGSDARGKAYGILEISRIIGVSPWEWWADVTPEKRITISIEEIAGRLNGKPQSPSVQYRGIFLNDEDWGLLPWADKKYGYELIDGVQITGNPRWKGTIAPQAYEKIFQLLLRLRANTIWPAMHECTVPFYFVKGNREMADKYGIVVGTSHCEPLVRNSASEWDFSGKGDYNFITNRQNVLDYWAERLQELKNSENIFTIGMRGKHDGMMQGVKTLEEHKSALSQIIPAQQELLEKHINPKKDEIPQAFIPYKEVLDVYDAGLEVPDYVTLVWCDDNYGYIRRLSDENEQQRKGGAGVYYHVSYWGQPHDYLWLASTSPALIYTEMKRAYEHNAKKLWILNVGDIKPSEYLTEFFMDMAWNVNDFSKNNVFFHLEKWAEREFGKQNADAITSVMKEYYRLANFRKPEFMGWSRVEEQGYTRGLTPVKDSDYNPSPNNELQRRIDDYRKLENQVINIKKSIHPNLNSAFFQLVEYPVYSASLINQKWLYKQLSNYVLNMGNVTEAKEFAAKSLNAYTVIDSLTNRYNTLENEKWLGMMDFRPRNLPVFNKSDFQHLDSSEIKIEIQTQKEFSHIFAQNANNATNLNTKGIEGLGHSFSAIEMLNGQTLDFSFNLPEAGEYNLKIGTLPNHDIDGKGMKIEVLLNDKSVNVLDYSVRGRSETWKQNVLRGQTVSTVKLNFNQSGEVKISIKAHSENIILDQIMLMQNEMDFYEFPVKTQF